MADEHRRYGTPTESASKPKSIDPFIRSNVQPVFGCNQRLEMT